MCFWCVLLFYYTAHNTLEAQQQCFIYQDSVLMNLQGYTQKMSSLDSVRNAYTSEIQTMQQDQQRKYRELLEPYKVQQNESVEQIKARLSAADKEKFALLQEEDKLLDMRIKTYNKLLQQQYDRDIQPYYDLITKALETYALKNKIDFIWKMDEVGKQTAYFNKSKNITRIIVDMVNKNLVAVK